MTTYFIAQDVCDKLNIRNSSQVFKTHSLIEGRDYIKFKPSMNSTLFKYLIDNQLIDHRSTSVTLFTDIGVMEVLFKSKNLEAKSIKDDILGCHDYSIYESTEYSLVGKIYSLLPTSKRQKFINDEYYAISCVQQKVDIMNEKLLHSIKIISAFSQKNISPTSSIGIEFNVDKIRNYFLHFTLV